MEDKIIYIFDEPHFSGCSYGQPSGPDDYNTECDCGINDEESKAHHE